MVLSRIIALVTISILWGSPGWSQTVQQKRDTEADSARAIGENADEVNERMRRLESMKQAAAEYEVTLDMRSKEKLGLQSEPVLRWTNPVRGTTDGAVFIWLADGRPELAAGIYKWSSQSGEPDMEHELSSLAVGRLTARRDGRPVWEPSNPGVTFREIPGAAAPAESAALRLPQLRTLAREFSAFYDDLDKAREELRLLPRPLYRYEKTGPDLLDGALFAFAQATDPEVLLLVEARRTDAGHRWQYALARMTSRALRVHHKDQEVWKALNCWAQVTDRQASYTAFFRQRVGQ